MEMLEGKRGLVVGIANENSIAVGCGQSFKNAGADLAITYGRAKSKPFVEPIAQALEASIFMPMDVEIDRELSAVFDEIERLFSPTR